MRSSKRPEEGERPVRLMCAACFKALGPFDQKTYTGFAQPDQGTCGWCNRCLEGADLSQVHHVYESETLPYTFDENMSRACRSFSSLERVLPGLSRIEVTRAETGDFTCRVHYAEKPQ